MSDNASRVFQAQRLLETGKLKEAGEALARVMERDAAHPAANMVLSRLYFQLGKHFLALQHARRAAAEAPQSAEMSNNLAMILAMTRRRDEAIEVYRQTVALDPANPAYREDLAVQLTMAFRTTESIQTCREALEKFPSHGRLMRALFNALLTAGDSEQALQIIREAARTNPTDTLIAESYAFVTNYVPGVDVAESLAAHVAHAKLVQSTLKPLVLARPRPNLDPERPLRVGVISPDLWAHAVATFLQPILEHFDRERFEFTCYSTDPLEDHITSHLASLATRFERVTTVGPRDLARLISTHAIDILIDLSGLTANHRLPVFLYRPAPVQVTYLGYPNTTGATTIDYRVVDSLTDPAPTADAHATERLVRLDPCFLCYRIPDYAPDPGPPPSAARGVITFGSLNDLKKLSSTTLELWTTILKQVPDSRLILKNFGLTHEVTRTSVINRFASLGIDPSRIEAVAPVKEPRDHLATYQGIDIALDTFPYHGTTTTCEALGMSVPVITLAGDRHASRVGVSLLTSVGLTECIAQSPDEYVRIAVQLAADVPRLASIRSSLRDRLAGSPLSDAPAHAARFCNALRTMWRDHVAAQPVAGSKR